MKNRIKVALAAMVVVGFSSCVSNVSSSLVRKEGMKNEIKARGILAEAWDAHGMANLKRHEVYRVKAVDDWKGMMGNMSKMWPQANTELDLMMEIGTFNSKVNYLNGKTEGHTHGQQSWHYYEEVDGKRDFKKRANKKSVFGLSAYHYFFEIADRLQNAELITYAGETSKDGEEYDQVFVTWKKLKSHKKHDQYKLWINKKTKLIDFCEYTVHDAYLPGGAMIPASIEFTEMKSVDGFMVPFEQYVYIGKPKAHDKYLHFLKLSSFEFDSFEVSELHPNSGLAEVGDAKPE